MTNAEAIAVDQDSLGAVGADGREQCLCQAARQLYFRPVRRAAAESFQQCGEPDGELGGPWTGRRFDGHACAISGRTPNLGTFAGSYTATNIPAHGSVLLKMAGTFDWNRPRTYEAESGLQQLSPAMLIMFQIPLAFSSSAYVTGVGNGAANAFQFNKVAAPSNGLYKWTSIMPAPRPARRS